MYNNRIEGTHDNECVAAERRPQAVEELDGLNQQVIELSELTLQFIDKLNPVMVSYPEENLDKTGHPEPHRCAVAQKIYENKKSLEEIRNRLYRAMSQVEV